MQSPLEDQPASQVAPVEEATLFDGGFTFEDQPMTPTSMPVVQKFEEPTYNDLVIDDEDIVPHMNTVKTRPVSHVYGPAALSSPVKHQEDLRKIIAKRDPSVIEAPHQVVPLAVSAKAEDDFVSTSQPESAVVPVKAPAHTVPELPTGKVVFFPLHPPPLSVDLKVHLHRVFLAHDTDGDGFIDRQEQIKVFSDLQYNYSDQFYMLQYERTLQQLNVRGDDFALVDLYAAGLTETLFLTMYRIFTALHVKVLQKLTTLQFLHCEIDITRPRKEVVDGVVSAPMERSGYIMVHEVHSPLVTMLTKSVVLSPQGALDYDEISHELQLVSGKGGVKEREVESKEEVKQSVPPAVAATDNTNNSLLNSTSKQDETMLGDAPLTTLKATTINSNRTKHNDLTQYKSFVAQHDNDTTGYTISNATNTTSNATTADVGPVNSTEAGKFARVLYPQLREEQLYVDNLYDFSVQFLNRVGNFSTVYAPFPAPVTFSAANQLGYLLWSDLPGVLKSLGFPSSNQGSAEQEEAKASLHEEKVKICQLNNTQELPFSTTGDDIPVTKTMFSVLYRRGAANFSRQRFGEHLALLLSTHWDVNRDGTISRDELCQGIIGMVGANFVDSLSVQAFVEARLHFLQSLDKIYLAEQARRAQAMQFNNEGGKNQKNGNSNFPRTTVGKDALLPTAATTLQDPLQYLTQPLPLSRPLTVFTTHDLNTLYDVMDLDENGSVSVSEFLTAAKHITETRVGKETPLSLQIAVLLLQKQVRAEQMSPVTLMSLLQKLPKSYSMRVYTAGQLRSPNYSLAAFYAPVLSISGLGLPGFQRNPHSFAMYSQPTSFQNSDSAIGHVSESALKAFKPDSLLPLPGQQLGLDTERIHRSAGSYTVSRAHTALRHATGIATNPQVDSSIWPFLHPAQVVSAEETPAWTDKGTCVQFSVQIQKAENIPMPDIYFGKNNVIDLRMHVSLMSDLKPVSNVLVVPASSKLASVETATLLKSHPTHTTSLDWDFLKGDENSQYSYSNSLDTEGGRKYSTLGPHNILIKTKSKTHLFVELVAVVSANEETPTARSLQGVSSVQAAPLAVSVGWGQLDIDSVEKTQIKTQRVPLYCGTPDHAGKTLWAAEGIVGKTQKDAVLVMAVSSTNHLSKRQRDLCRFQPVHTQLPVHAVRVARLCRELQADIAQSTRKRSAGNAGALQQCIYFALQHQSVQYEVSCAWEALREHIPAGKREDISDGMASAVAKTVFAAFLLRQYPLLHSCGGDLPVYSAVGTIAADSQGTLSTNPTANVIVPPSSNLVHPIQQLASPPSIDLQAIRSALLAGDLFIQATSDGNRNFALSSKDKHLEPVHEQDEMLHLDNQFLREDAPVIPEETVDGTQSKRGYLLPHVQSLKAKINRNDVYSNIQSVAANTRFHTSSELVPLHTATLSTLTRTACTVDTKRIDQIHKDVMNPTKTLPLHLTLTHKPFHTDELAFTHKSQKSLRATLLDVAEGHYWSQIPL